jgi:superfamily II DNA or RNA helicase
MGAVAGLAAGQVGAGSGLLVRAKYEDRFKKERDRDWKDTALHRAPILGAIPTAAIGATIGYRKTNKAWKQLLDMGVLRKTAALRKEVKLQDHQTAAIARAEENDGQLLVAHATGTGKTLTGIAAFENLKAKGKAKRALVVTPASLRTNFRDNGVKKFTNSTVATYGPKGEKETKNIGQKSKADYNIVSYELFREHGDKLLADTGADTLIMDEIHRSRATEGVTYNKIRDLRDKFKNAITLTGSVVNNEPNEVVPLLDITYKPTGHRLVSKDFFDKLFVKKDAQTVGGFLSAKTVVNKSLTNKPQLAKYLANKIDFISHEAVEKNMPKRKLETIEIPMSKEQKRLYEFSMSSVDPITRWKIRNNIPVGQKEAQDAFSKLLQARQVSTDPGILDAELAKAPDPATHSPKIKRVVEDLKKHLEEDKANKSVIFGNLLKGQLEGVEKSLKHNGIEYATFFGTGNEGNSAKKRDASIKAFQAGDKRVLLISGAGAEGLDLKNANMMQILEGHYNPERIQQAEARVRRMGAPVDEVQIKRYLSVPTETKSKFGLAFKSKIGSDRGVDHWVYSIAEKKDKLNHDFRDVLKEGGHHKTAMDFDFEELASGDPETSIRNNFAGIAGQTYGNAVGSLFGNLAVIPMKKRSEKAIETHIKQRLLDLGHENLTSKRHYKNILAESKLDERAIDATMGTTLVASGLATLMALNPNARKGITKTIQSGLNLVSPMRAAQFGRTVAKNPFIVPGILGVATGLGTAPLTELAKRKLMVNAMGGTNDLNKGIDLYREKLRKKALRKYKGSKSYVNEYETKEELGIDHA